MNRDNYHKYKSLKEGIKKKTRNEKRKNGYRMNVERVNTMLLDSSKTCRLDIFS